MNATEELMNIVNNYDASITITKSGDKVMVFSRNTQCRQELETWAKNNNLACIRKDQPSYYQGREMSPSVLIGREFKSSVDSDKVANALSL